MDLIERIWYFMMANAILIIIVASFMAYFLHKAGSELVKIAKYIFIFIVIFELAIIFGIVSI